jgi:hypothetical protein
MDTGFLDAPWGCDLRILRGTMNTSIKSMAYLLLSVALIFTGCEIGNDDKKSSNFNLLALLGGGEWHWEQVGGSLENNPSSIIEWPQITVKGTTPYVCWVEHGQLYVKHFDGSSWVQDGGSLNVNNNSGVAYPVIISDNTSVYVNFREMSDACYGFGFYVKKLTAAGWEVVGNNYVNNDAATDSAKIWDTSSIAINNNGTLYFTMEQMDYNRTFYFDGSAWQDIYYDYMPWYYMYAFYPQLVFNNNILYIIWQDTLWPGAESYIDVAYFDNNTQKWVRPWDPLNYNNLNSNNRVNKPRMAASSDSILYAVWNESDGSKFNIYVKKLSGSSWVSVGSACLNVDPVNSATNQDITCVGTTPYVVWQEIDINSHYSSIYVKHFNGTEWVQDGPALNVGSAGVQNPRIASDGTTPYVTWVEQDQSSNNHVYVKRWVK